MPVVHQSTNIVERVNYPGQNGLPAIGDSIAGIDKLPSVWGNVDFSGTFAFTLINSETSLEVPVTSITIIQTPDFLEASSTGSNLVLKKSDNDIFEETYRYVTFKDDVKGTQKVVKPSQRTDDLSIIEWSTPDDKFIQDDIRILANHSLGSVPINLTQWFYWNMDISLAVFDEQVSRSRW